MKKITRKELDEILEQHELWLLGKGGKKADLSYTDLSCISLSGIDLRDADLSYTDLSYTNLRSSILRNVDLRGAILRGADLWKIDLRDADLRNADLSDIHLRDANLSGADLANANLEDTDLTNTDLTNTNLRGSNLKNVDLRGANLKNIKTNMFTIGYNLACPEEGSFIAFKKANRCIVKLLILEDSKRSSATTAKCRCDKAKVLEIKEIETGKSVKRVSSNYDFDFIYEVGKVVSVDDFDEDRWNECSTGIHFFVNKENAINY